MVASIGRYPLWVAFIALWLVACSAAPPLTLSTEADESAERELTLWHALSTRDAAILQSIADEWAANQPEPVVVQLQRSVDEDTLHSKLTAAIQTDMPPHLAFVRAPDLGTYIDANALVRLDALMENGPGALEPDEVEDFFTNFWESVRYAQGTTGLYAWPVYRYETLLFLNRTRIEELGGKVPPSSWTAMTQTCAAHREQGGPRCMAAFPTADIALLMLWSVDGSLLNEMGDAPAFQEEAGQEVMTWLAEMRAIDGIFMVPSYDAKVEEFVDGRSIFTFDSTSAIPAYESRINSAFDMAVVPPPHTGDMPVTLATGGNIALFRSNQTTEALAWDFLRYLTSTDTNSRWAEALGAYPVRRSSLERMDRNWPEFSRLREASKWLDYARAEPAVREWPAVGQIFAEAMIQTINGQTTPESALGDAARRAQGLLTP